MKQLIGLEDWNEDKFNKNGEPNLDLIVDFRNGLSCPFCGHELIDGGEEVYTCYPLKMKVGCTNCRFKGTRIFRTA